MIVQAQEESFIELEGTWELCVELPRALDKLCEHWRHLLRVPSYEATSVRELVPKRQPLFLYQSLKHEFVRLNLKKLLSPIVQLSINIFFKLVLWQN